MLRYLVLLATMAAGAGAQPAATGFPIESIRVEGSELYAAEQIIPVTGLRAGETGNRSVFEAARDRLLDCGAFVSVAFQYGPSESGSGYAVTFEVTDFKQVYPYRLEHMPVPEESVRAYLEKRFPLFSGRIPGSSTMLERYREAIQEYLAANGLSTKLTARISAELPGEPYVSFFPGDRPPVVADIRFQGNEAIPSAALQAAFRGVAIGSEYTESRMRVLLDASVRPLYEAQGLLRVDFPKIEGVPASDVKGIQVTIEIEEGPSYNFGEFRVEGAGERNAELAKTGDVRAGDLANFDHVKQAQERIHQALRRSGYMRVSSVLERTVDDARRVVDLVLRVTPGAQYSFGKLILQGLDLHTEPAVKRLWGLASGKPFNADYPDYFLTRLREDQIFENLSPKTRAEIAVHDESATVDVTLVFVAEAPDSEKPGRPF